MSTKETVRMIEAYNSEAEPTRFLTSLFRSPAENFYNSESVEIDISRSDEEISIVITDLSTGYRYNSADLYTNKKFTPPIMREAGPLNAFDLMGREPGQNPFQNPNFQRNATRRAMDLFRKMEKKIRRTIELQASQVLTTGVITLTDENGAALYTVDFKAKATHFPTAGTAWTGAADIAQDILDSSNVNRNDGLLDSDRLLMGEGSFEAFIKNADIRSRFDNRRIDNGTLPPIVTGQAGTGGGQFRGTVDIGTYKYQVWTYGGRFINPDGGTKDLYLPNDKCIVMSSGSRLDATFGNIPQLVRPDRRVLPFLPGRMSNRNGRMDMITNAWVTADGEQLFVSVAARPLLIPTAIDTYSCISTGV